MNSFYTLGIDEAGRGCVIGPLIVGCVSASASDRAWFSKNRVRDSKIVPPDERTWLAEKIMARCWYRVSIASPAEIDEAVRDRSRTLNGLEKERMAELLRYAILDHAPHLSTLRAVIDAPSINAKRFSSELQTLCNWKYPEYFLATHRADARFLPVAAASIIAKHIREQYISQLKQELGTDFGCGYPHDQKTKKHLAMCTKNAPHIRWTWSTANMYTRPS